MYNTLALNHVVQSVQCFHPECLSDVNQVAYSQRPKLIDIRRHYLYPYWTPESSIPTPRRIKPENRLFKELGHRQPCIHQIPNHFFTGSRLPSQSTYVGCPGASLGETVLSPTGPSS